MAVPERTFGCSWEPVTPRDLPELADLVSAIEYLDNAVQHHGLDELAMALADPDSDVARETVLLRDEEGTVVGYGWNQCPGPDEPLRRVFLSGGSHPSWRNRGVGATILDYLADRAAEWDAETRRDGFGPLELVALADGENAREIQLLAAAGFVPQRWVYSLHQNFDPAAQPWHLAPIDGIDIVPWRADKSDEARLVHNASQQHRSWSVLLDRDAWGLAVADPGTRTDLSWMALAGGRVVGFALNGHLPGEPIGWTERIAALDAWRNRGLLRALLATSLNAFSGAGFAGAGVGVDADSPSAVLPYQGLGYGVVGTVAWYVRRDPASYSVLRTPRNT